MVRTDRNIGSEQLGIQSELVFQHTYGIVAQQRDLNGITRLLMPGIFTCFVLSLHDPKANIGAVTHIDVVNEFITIFPDIVEKLRELGGNAFRLRTANINGPSVETAGGVGMKLNETGLTQQDIEVHKMVVGMMQEYLQRGGLNDANDDFPGIDIGSTTYAYFDAATGLQLVTEKPSLTREQDLAMRQSCIRGLLDELNGVNPLLQPYTPSYLPQVVQ